MRSLHHGRTAGSVHRPPAALPGRRAGVSLDPLIAAWLEETKDAPPPASLAALRAATETGLRQLHGPLEGVAAIKDYVLPGEHALTVRAYVPAGAQTGQPLPAIVFAHGGGWCLCSLDLYDNPCRALANATSCVIFSVDYRWRPSTSSRAARRFFLPGAVLVRRTCGGAGHRCEPAGRGCDSAGRRPGSGGSADGADQAGPAWAPFAGYPALVFAFDPLSISA